MNALLARQEPLKSINDNLGDSGAFPDRLLLDGIPQFVTDTNCADRCGHLPSPQHICVKGGNTVSNLDLIIAAVIVKAIIRFNISANVKFSSKSNGMVQTFILETSWTAETTGR